MSEQHEASEAPGRGAVFVPDPRRSITYRTLRRALRIVLVLWFRPQLEGPGRVPDSGPVIIAPVHRSIVDFAFAIFLTERKLFFIAKDSLWRSRLLGRFLLAMGAFPVHRESADRSALNHAASVLEAGQVLVLFPEGTRQEGPLVGETLEGAAFLAGRAGAPVVPLGIGGSAAAMPKGSKIPKRVRVRLYAGEIIDAPTPNDKGRVPRSEVRAKSLQIRSAIQDAFDRASA